MLLLKRIKRVISHRSRLKKWNRKTNMRQIKIALGVIGASSCFITLLLYYWHRSSFSDHRTLRPHQKTTEPSLFRHISATPMRHVPLDEVYKDNKYNDDYDSFEIENKRPSMIDTLGCQIPVVMVKYNTEKNKKRRSCGKRAVFLKKVDNDKVHVTIKARAMKKYLRKSATFHCCYKFISRSTLKGHEDTRIKYTKCRTLNDGATVLLETDFINVRCFEHDKRNQTHVIYTDIYGFNKKIDFPKPNKNKCKEKYNILMIGIDSMSLPRIVQTMPRTVAFFKDNYWLGFRGYHKIGDNTFPNLMAAITGMNMSTVTTKCSGKMDSCSDLLIWNKYKEIGYVTAYGEDQLRLPDTFSKTYSFTKQPTHHYMRPLFINGETEFDQTLVCAGKQSSGQQVLDYAFDFVNTYRSDSFFGLFWMNSFSHNANSRPHDSDKIVENFLNKLTYTGALINTFVIFFSDHGIRFGEYRLQVESYYDERMPILFMWIPIRFKERHPQLCKALAINQFKLTTPYDLYNTLMHIKKISTCDNSTAQISEGCPKCQNLFEAVNGNRTCEDVSIHPKWCSCHRLYPIDIQDGSGVKTVLHVVSYIQTIIKSIKTQRCWGCMTLSLLKIIRTHFYYDNDKINLHCLVAFVMTPGNVTYEATVQNKHGKMDIIGPVSIISMYRGLGKCTIHHKDRLFCVCQKIENC